MGKLLYDQFVRECNLTGHSLSWDELPSHAKIAWVNVWRTSLTYTRASIAGTFMSNEHVTVNRILDELDKMR